MWFTILLFHCFTSSWCVCEYTTDVFFHQRYDRHILCQENLLTHTHARRPPSPHWSISMIFPIKGSTRRHLRRNRQMGWYLPHWAFFHPYLSLIIYLPTFYKRAVICLFVALTFVCYSRGTESRARVPSPVRRSQTCAMQVGTLIGDAAGGKASGKTSSVRHTRQYP